MPTDPSQFSAANLILLFLVLICVIGLVIVSIVTTQDINTLGEHICKTEHNLQFNYYDDDQVHCHNTTKEQNKTTHDDKIITINGGQRE